jgi:hypothetical protein
MSQRSFRALETRVAGVGESQRGMAVHVNEHDGSAGTPYRRVESDAFHACAIAGVQLAIAKA